MKGGQRSSRAAAAAGWESKGEGSGKLEEGSSNNSKREEGQKLQDGRRAEK